MYPSIVLSGQLDEGVFIKTASSRDLAVKK